MKRQKYILTLILSFSLLGLAACRARSPLKSDPKLAGGEFARAGLFPAAVAIPGCTATKIASHLFLTAAHCVIDVGLRGMAKQFVDGATFNLYYGVQLAHAVKFPVKVRRAVVHPSYVAALRAHALSKKSGLFSGTDESVDIALVEIVEETPGISVAVLSDRSPSDGMPIVIGGYGCEYDYVREQMEAEERRKMLPDEQSGGSVFTSDVESDPDRLGKRRLKWTPYKVDLIGPAVFKIRFDTFPNNLPKACPGDSGGAVYFNDLDPNEDVKKHTFLQIVGVNSRIGPLENTFARVDQSDALRIRACLMMALTGKGFAVDGAFGVFCSAQ